MTRQPHRHAHAVTGSRTAEEQARRRQLPSLAAGNGLRYHGLSRGGRWPLSMDRETKGRAAGAAKVLTAIGEVEPWRFVEEG